MEPLSDEGTSLMRQPIRKSYALIQTQNHHQVLCDDELLKEVSK